ncbi:hypothetical protein GQ457_09G018310 [Hibiscus cannabinus]
MEEGQIITNPSFFNGANYPYWKNKMILFIQSTDYMIWDVVLDGPFTPVKSEGDSLVPKQRHEWNEEEMTIVEINSKAMHILFCELGPYEYAKMSSCSSGKEIWDKLEVTHEGTSEVKETKIDILNLSYENFNMEPDEDIKIMFNRFSVVVNGLKDYGEIILEDKLTRKLDEIMGSLLNYELMRQGKMKKRKRMKKRMRLKRRANVSTWSDEESSDDDEEEVTNLCLMALDDDTKVTTNSYTCDLTYNELLDEYEELQEVYDELVEKYKESILKNKKIILDLKNERYFFV